MFPEHPLQTPRQYYIITIGTSELILMVELVSFKHGQEENCFREIFGQIVMLMHYLFTVSMSDMFPA